MKQRAFAANQSLTVQGWDKLTLLHMMVASHRVLLHTSTSGRMARQAYDWLSLAPLFLDTETTGLDNTAEALEIGLTDVAVFETRLKPTVAIGVQAAAVHGMKFNSLSIKLLN